MRNGSFLERRPYFLWSAGGLCLYFGLFFGGNPAAARPREVLAALGALWIATVSRQLWNRTAGFSALLLFVSIAAVARHLTWPEERVVLLLAAVALPSILAGKRLARWEALPDPGPRRLFARWGLLLAALVTGFACGIARWLAS